jgi:adenylate cyclase
MAGIGYRIRGGSRSRTGHPGVTADVDRAFALLERRAESVLAAIRLLALCILALVFGVIGTAEHGEPVMVPLTGLIAVTLATPLLANLKLLRPWVLWLFSTLDVAMLSRCLVMVADANGQPLQMALQSPVALLIFVFLATAALRHRPLLVLYTGGIFVVGWAAMWLGEYMRAGSWVPGAFTTDVATLTVVVITSFALFVTVRRARRALTTAIAETQLREKLSRYFSAPIVDEIAQTGSAARSFQSRKVAILFADLRDFTALAEQMAVDQVAHFLNDYRRRIADPIARNGGVIDKFIGDGVMAIFGVPEASADDARNAVRAGLELVSTIEAWRCERLAQGLPAVEVGIGIHYGDVIAGALGDDQRLEYSVVGDAVNTASRIERLTSDLGAPLLVSAEVLGAAPGLEQELRIAQPFTQLLRGRSQPIQLYRVSAQPKLPSKSSSDGASASRQASGQLRHG